MRAQTPPQRTKSGCWTCRLRRKKCNEGGPPCDNCHARSIHCHGYGPKPAWKDRGALEKEEARRLKYQAGRARSQSTTTLPPMGEAVSGAVNGDVAQEVSQEGSCITASTANFLTDANEAHFMSDFSVALETPTSLMDFHFDNSPNSDALPGRNSSTSTESAISLDWTHFQLVSPELSIVTQTTAPSSASNIHPVDLCPIQSLLQPEPSSLNERSFDLAETEKGIGLVMQYISTMCSEQTQGPRAVANISDMGWVLLLITRSPAFYYATLSLSSYRNYLVLPHNGDARSQSFQDYQNYRTRALDQMSKLSAISTSAQASSSPFIISETLICDSQLAQLEVCLLPIILPRKVQRFTWIKAISGNAQDCQRHIEAAVKVLVEHENVLVAETSHFSAMELKALTFFVIRLMWNDVLVSSAKKLAPRGEKVYRKLLANDKFETPVKTYTGCEGWVMLAIIDSTLLESWRHEQEASGSLSIRALISRAEKIERTVEEHIQRLSDVLTRSEDGNKGSAVDSSAASSAVPLPIISGEEKTKSVTLTSMIFAQAVLTDIHRIVSGPRSCVPEISESIDRSLSSAWKLHQPSKPIDRIWAWPYCVTASLSKGPQREIFRDMITDSQCVSDSVARHLKSVVEQCWVTLDKPEVHSSSSCRDWKDVVQRSNMLELFLI